MKKNKSSIFNGVKFLALALPLLFAAPIIITIGFKALKKDHSYIILMIGIIMALIAMIVTAIGVVKLTKHFFDKDSNEE